MIEKIELDEHKGDILDVVLYRLMQLIDKTNEIIDYLNDTSKTTKRTYMSTKTGVIIDD